MRRGALAQRSFRLLLVGRTVSSVGDGVVPVALSFAVLELTGSVKDLGLILAAQSVPLIGFVLLGGVWADRVQRRLVMLASDVVRAGAQGASAALLLSGSAHVWELAALQGVYGAARAFFGPAATGLLPQTVAPEDLQQANSLIGMGENVASIAGPALGGVFVVALGAGWGLVFDAGAFLVSAASLAAMRLAPFAPSPRRGTLAELRDGWRAFSSRTWLFVSVLSLPLFITIVFVPFEVLGPAISRAHLGGAGAWAAINTGSAVGALAGSFVGLKWKPAYPLRMCFLLPLAGEPAMLVLLGGVHVLAPIVAFALISGMASTVFNVLWFTIMQQEIAAEELARVSSWDHLGTYALQPLGFAVIGPIALAVGYATTLYACAALVVALTAAVLALPSVRDFRPSAGL